MNPVFAASAPTPSLPPSLLPLSVSDVMGLGKTVESLAGMAMRDIIAKGEGKLNLVVVPTEGVGEQASQRRASTLTTTTHHPPQLITTHHHHHHHPNYLSTTTTAHHRPPSLTAYRSPTNHSG